MSHTAALAPFGEIPSPRQILWQSTELYGFIHFGVNTFTNREWGYGDESPEMFNPSACDPDQWVGVAKETGLRGLVLVCKHHDGFCLWPTKTTDHSIRQSPWENGQGDLVAEVSQACRRHGLKFGVYISPWDRNHPEFARPGYVPVFHEQVREVLSNYGPIFLVWFDGASADEGYYGGAREARPFDAPTYYDWPKVEAMVRTLQPGACIFNIRDIRCVGNEHGFANDPCWATRRYAGLPDFSFNAHGGTGDRDGVWMPPECDFPLRKGWFYHPGDEVRSPETLFQIYLKSVGRGSTMSIGLAPDTRGLIHDEDIAALRGFQALREETFSDDLLRLPGVSVAGASAASAYGPEALLSRQADGFWLADSATEPELIFTLDEPRTFNLLSLDEHIELGQRIEEVVAEAWLEDAWVEVGRATSIGYRRLLPLLEVVAARLRLRFTRFSAPPTLRHVGLHRMPARLLLDGPISITRDNSGRVHIRAAREGVVLRHTVDGSEPGADSPRYTGPFAFPGCGTVRAFAHLPTVPSARTGSASATFGISRAGWRVVRTSLDSPFKNDGAAGVEKLLEDDPLTYWHTYHNDKALSAPPHHVIIDMGAPREIAAFTFMPRLRPDEAIPEGIPDRYAFAVSDDGRSWTTVASGEFPNIKANPGLQVVPLAKQVTASLFRFDALRVIDDGDYVVVAGLGVLPRWPM